MNSEGYCYYKHIWCKPKSYNGRCVCCSFINSASGLSSAFPCSTLLWRRLLACEVFFLGFFANCTFRGLVWVTEKEKPVKYLSFSFPCAPFPTCVASAKWLHLPCAYIMVWPALRWGWVLTPQKEKYFTSPMNLKARRDDLLVQKRGKLNQAFIISELLFLFTCNF